MKSGPLARVFSGVVRTRQDGILGAITQVLWVHPDRENASAGFLEGVFYRRRRREAENGRRGAMLAPVSEDERLELVRTAAEAHSGLSEIAFKLRRELPAKAPALKEALKAERVAFRLKRELQKLDLTDCWRQC